MDEIKYVERFLGHDISYWIELNKRAKELDATKLLEDIAILSAKVTYYEMKFNEIEEFRKVCSGMVSR